MASSGAPPPRPACHLPSSIWGTPKCAKMAHLRSRFPLGGGTEGLRWDSGGGMEGLRGPAGVPQVCHFGTQALLSVIVNQQSLSQLCLRLKPGTSIRRAEDWPPYRLPQRPRPYVGGLIYRANWPARQPDNGIPPGSLT